MPGTIGCCPVPFIVDTAQSCYLRKKGGRMFTICFLSTTLNVPSTVLQLLVLQESIPPDLERFCQQLSNVAGFLRGLVLFTAYLFLWLRQRSVYAHPILSRMLRKRAMILGWFILVVILFASCVTSFVSFVPDTSAYDGISQSEIGCGVTDIEEGTQTFFLLIGSCMLAQVVMLALFVYPLVANKPPEFQASSQIKKNKILRTIHRSTICALITILTDILAFAVAYTASSAKHPLAISTSLMQIDVFINSLAIITTCDNWERMLIPTLPRCSKEKDPVSERTQELPEGDEV